MSAAFELPLWDERLPEEAIEAHLDRLRSGWLTMGPRTQELEAAAAAATGRAHAVAVSTGTTALQLALIAAGVAGREVVVPALAVPAVLRAVHAAGARAVACDVREDDLGLDPEALRALPSGEVAAVVLVHLAGVPADAAGVAAVCAERGWALIEDGCQALGAETAPGVPVGSTGLASCFSASARKGLGTGEGGLLVTDDDAVRAAAASLRSHAMTSMSWDRHRGHAETYDIVDIGFNFRMDEPRAAAVLARLAPAVEAAGRRRELDAAYRDRLGATEAAVAARPGAAPHGFPVRTADPDALAQALAGAGIGSGRFLATADPGTAPVAARLAGSIVVLPLWPRLGEDDVERIAAIARLGVRS